MSLSTITENKMACCCESHIPIYHNKDFSCPLCIAIESGKYHRGQTESLCKKYEALYQRALEFSPEILV